MKSLDKKEFLAHLDEVMQLAKARKNAFEKLASAMEKEEKKTNLNTINKNNNQ